MIALAIFLVLLQFCNFIRMFNAEIFYSEIGGLIQALSLFGHSMAQALENGGATCNMAPDGQGQSKLVSRYFF